MFNWLQDRTLKAQQIGEEIQKKRKDAKKEFERLKFPTNIWKTLMSVVIKNCKLKRNCDLPLKLWRLRKHD